jgi:acyl-CoA thioester hydrolase
MFESLTFVEVRVRYAETDQMGVAHHANYLIWCELARTRHMAQLGVDYRDLEAAGLHLPVTEAHLRYRAAARFDDLLRVRCWVRDVRSRRVEFGYAVERPADDDLLATARTSLMAVDSNHVITTIPADLRALMAPVPDPIRL